RRQPGRRQRRRRRLDRGARRGCQPGLAPRRLAGLHAVAGLALLLFRTGRNSRRAGVESAYVAIPALSVPGVARSEDWSPTPWGLTAPRPTSRGFPYILSFPRISRIRGRGFLCKKGTCVA